MPKTTGMGNVYLLAGTHIDYCFGFKIGIRQILELTGISLQEYRISEDIRLNYGTSPIVKNVFIVASLNQRDVWIEGHYEKRTGLVAEIDVHTDKNLSSCDTAIQLNENLLLDGNYLDNLRKYLHKPSNSDRVVITRREIIDIVERDIGVIVGREFLKVIIEGVRR